MKNASERCLEDSCNVEAPFGRFLDSFSRYSCMFAKELCNVDSKEKALTWRLSKNKISQSAEKCGTRSKNKAARNVDFASLAPGVFDLQFDEADGPCQIHQQYRRSAKYLRMAATVYIFDRRDK